MLLTSEVTNPLSYIQISVELISAGLNITEQKDIENNSH